MMNTKSYSELIKLPTFLERYRYLKLSGRVGVETFGPDRYLNQLFYKYPEWKSVRDYVILRDNGCDLAIPNKDILTGKILIHHMNPITKEDILNRSELLLNPEYLICVTLKTHNAIHYGDESLLYSSMVIERRPDDTCPWK